MITFSTLTTLAYLDPGSGSMLVQMLLAAAAGVFLFLKFQGRKVMRLFRRNRKPNA